MFLVHYLLLINELFLLYEQFQLLLAEDGSGKGAGLAAAIAMKLRGRTNGVA